MSARPMKFLLLSIWVVSAIPTDVNAQDPIDVTAFGATGDGVNDDTAAIEAAIAAVPAKEFGWSHPSANRAEHAATIVFPNPDAFYRVTHRIVIPNHKNVRFMGPSSHSARIRMDSPSDPPEPYMFMVSKDATGDTQRAVIFEKLIFHRGGILLDADTRRFTAIRDCVFNDTPDYAVNTAGPGVVDVEVSRCQISECARGINVGFQQSDLWVISHCGFVRNRGVDLRIATSGVHVRDCDFEVRPADYCEQPYIHMEPDQPPHGSSFVPGGDIVIHNCRFGNEAHPPREAVVIGPLGTTSDRGAGSIWFRDCNFRGANQSAPNATQGKTAILMNMPVSGMRVEGCSFGPYWTLVDERFVEHPSHTAQQKSDYQYWTGNSTVTIPNLSPPVIFSHGGRGWYVDPATQEFLRPASLGRVTRNLLPTTDHIDAANQWAKSQAFNKATITIVKNATGPDLVENSGYTLSRPNHVASSFMTSPWTASVSGPVVFSVWLKAGTIQTARLAIANSESGFASRSIATRISLTQRWERYSVIAPEAVATTTFQAYIYVGGDGDTSTSGDIYMAFPQLEEGFVPSSYISNPDPYNAVRAARQFQGLVLGTRTISTADAPPPSGRYEVGDMVYNSVPETGQPIGWVCTKAGSPGTWRPFGMVQ